MQAPTFFQLSGAVFTNILILKFSKNFSLSNDLEKNKSIILAD